MEAKNEEARNIGSKKAHLPLFSFSAKSVSQTDSDGSRYILGSKNRNNPHWGN